MREYHKIDSIFFRDPENKFKTFLEGQYSRPEFEYLENEIWDFTEKVDGTNIRVGLENGKLSFGGRTDKADIPATLVSKLIELFNIENMLETLKIQPDERKEIILFGEGYGAKIQGGGKYIPDGVNFVLFDVCVDGLWMPRDRLEHFADLLGIRVVPFFGQGTLERAVEIVKAGFKSAYGNFQAEGLVLRPSVELLDRYGKRIITKIKCKDFQK